MKLKTIFAAVGLSMTAAATFAADQTISLLSTGVNTYAGSFAAVSAPEGSLLGSISPVFSSDPLLSGGSDNITFTGAAAGVYQLVLNGSASFIQNLTGSLNGTPLTVYGDNQFSGIFTIGTASPPFALVLNGSAVANSLYSGNLTVTAVPEPQTYALMLAGLGVIGFIARRRRPQQN